MKVRVAELHGTEIKGTIYNRILRVKIDPVGALYLLKENGADVVCFAPGVWQGYSTEGADVD